MIGISSCLGGICCRYDGKSQEQEALKQLVTNGKAIMICPEVLGELPIPRPPAEIIGGDGFDVWLILLMYIRITGKMSLRHLKQGHNARIKN